MFGFQGSTPDSGLRCRCRRKPTLTEQDAHALIVKEARYRLGCEDFVPTFALRRAEPDTSGRYPRANWDATPEGRRGVAARVRGSFREAVLRDRGKYDIAC